MSSDDIVGNAKAGEQKEHNFPKGWRREIVVRKSGKTAGRRDMYIYRPDGYKFRSKKHLSAYLAKTESSVKEESTDSVVIVKHLVFDTECKKQINKLQEPKEEPVDLSGNNTNTMIVKHLIFNKPRTAMSMEELITTMNAGKSRTATKVSRPRTTTTTAIASNSNMRRSTLNYSRYHPKLRHKVNNV